MYSLVGNLLVNNIVKKNNDNNYSNNSNELIHLKFIAMIQKNEKINTRNLHTQSSSNFFTSVYRFFTSDNRNHTLNFINTTISRCTDLLKANIHSESIGDTLLCKTILRDLINAIEGLKNLQVTYENDKAFVCSISHVIEQINNKILFYQLTHKHLFDVEESIPPPPLI